MPPKRKSSATPKPEPAKKAKSSSGKTKNEDKAKVTKKTVSKLKVDPNFKKTTSFSLLPYLTDKSWREKLVAEFNEPYFQMIEQFLGDEYKKKKEIFPEKELIFNAFNTTPFDNVKAVILGQDPYHDVNQAQGLAFSVPKGTKPLPGSVHSMFKELVTDIPGFQFPDHGCLEDWAKQGVLLLNATITVEAHQPNSHSKIGWMTFTDKVIKILSAELSGIVFILWGGFAQKKEGLIDSSKHCILKAAHPSRMTCTKFFGCKSFSKTNDALRQFGKEPVDWTV